MAEIRYEERKYGRSIDRGLIEKIGVTIISIPRHMTYENRRDSPIIDFADELTGEFNAMIQLALFRQ